MDESPPQSDQTESPPRKKRLIDTLEKGNNRESAHIPFIVTTNKVEHSKEQHIAGQGTERQGSTSLDEDGTVTIKTLREAWGMNTQTSENQATTGAAPALRVKEMLETTHDQAARDMFAETQKSYGRKNDNRRP